MSAIELLLDEGVADEAVEVGGGGGVDVDVVVGGGGV